MSTAARWPSVDAEAWARFAVTGSLGAAILVTTGSYAALAFDRFGVQGVPRGLAFDLAFWRAMLVIVLTYSVWLAVVGRALLAQLEHLS